MNVIAIDDTRTNLQLMQHLLKRVPDVNSVLFQDSREGLNWCLEHDPDLIIVDYMMPAPDGLEFVKTMRSMGHEKNIPIVMVTANQLVDIRYEALECGTTDFLTKPIDTHEFTARIRNMLSLRAQQKALSEHAAHLDEEVRVATQKLVAREREIIIRLSEAAELKDPETGQHLLRMANYSALIAKAMGWTPVDCELLLLAAPMHDIGKVGIPDAILRKPGPLNEAELAVMRTHPQIGHRLLQTSDVPLLQLGAEIALSHHEKFDGSGYPFGLAGDRIPLSGRIVALADVFDALTSHRPYKKAWSETDTFEWLIAQRGTHFDPHCVDAMLSCRDEISRIRLEYQDEE